MLIVLIASKVTCQSAIWMAGFVSVAGNISLLRISGSRAFVWREKYWAGFIWLNERKHVDVICRFLESMEHSTKLQIVCGCALRWGIFSKCWQNGLQMDSTSDSHNWTVICIKLASIINRSLKEYFQTLLSSWMRTHGIAPTNSTWTLHSLVISGKRRAASSKH